MSTRVRWALVVIVGCLGASSLLFGQAAMQNTPTTPLPAAKDVIARYVTAIGGATAQKKITSLRMRGHLEMAAQGMSGDVEVSMARPAKSITRSEITGIGRIEEGFNGTIGWEVNPITGPQLAAGKKLSEMRDDAQFDSALHLPDSVKEMTTIGREEFDGHSAVKLKVVFISGNEQIEYYDSATGFQIGGELTRESPMGPLPSVHILRDYKKFGALMQPTVLVERAMGSEQVLRITSVEYDVVPADAFDPPPAIKALIKGSTSTKHTAQRTKDVAGRNRP